MILLQDDGRKKTFEVYVSVMFRFSVRVDHFLIKLRLRFSSNPLAGARHHWVFGKKVLLRSNGEMV
jgi:hypothetical protein